MIDRPMQVTQLLKEALDNKFPSLSEARVVDLAEPKNHEKCRLQEMG